MCNDLQIDVGAEANRGCICAEGRPFPLHVRVEVDIASDGEADAHRLSLGF